MIPSTPTPADKFAEVKKIQLYINELKSQEEIAQRSLKETLAGLTSLEDRKTTLIASISHHNDLVDEVVKKAEEVSIYAVSAMKEASTLVDSYKGVLSELSQKIDTSANDLKVIDGYKKASLEQLETERIGIETSKDDLKIYKSRLQKIIDDHNLNIKLL